MRNSEYLYRMTKLAHELERAASAEPYDPVAHGDIVTSINDLNLQWSKSLAERRRIKNILCCAAIVFVLYLLYVLLSELFI